MRESNAFLSPEYLTVRQVRSLLSQISRNKKIDEQCLVITEDNIVEDATTTYDKEVDAVVKQLTNNFGYGVRIRSKNIYILIYLLI